ncbi:MAG: HAMP domain-containing sensor histidine kinase [Rhodanobacter sp.]
MLTPHVRAGILPRLFVDSVLPCALAAWVLIGVVTFHRVQYIDDRAHLAIGLQLQRLVIALDRADVQSTQSLLDAAVRDGRSVGLAGIELRDAHGDLQHSGRIGDGSLERYRDDLPVRDGYQRRLTAHVDPAPRHRTQRLAKMYALGAGLGVLLLAWLAIHALRQRVIQPLRRLQQNLSDTIAGAATHAVETETNTEFVQLQASCATVRRLLEARGREAISSLRDSGIETLDQLRQSQAALRGKSQFVALVGHHFRQPLQALQLFAGSLHPGIDAEQQSVITQMRSSIADMTRLLVALLELSRLDAEVVTVHAAPIGVADLFQHCRAQLSEIGRRHGVTLHWHATAHSLVGDVELIGALLEQLVSNAVAWSPPQARVLIAARGRGARVRIEVRDRGPGIAAIHHRRIFEEFVRLHDEGEQRQGYGLGLAIAVRLARLLRTRVGIRSEPGRGSTFFFELPCKGQVDMGSPVLPVPAAAADNIEGGRVSIFRPTLSSERAMS